MVQDLRLPDNPGFQAGRHAKQVLDHLTPVEERGVLFQQIHLKWQSARQSPHPRKHVGIGGQGIDFESLTRTENHSLGGQVLELAQHDELLRGVRTHPLPYRQRCPLIGDSHVEQLRIHHSSSNPNRSAVGSSRPVIDVRRTV